MPDSPYKSRSTPRKAPRQARSLATVSAIVEAAARILEERGHEGFSTNAVAERAGVSVGSLYQYFPRKDALIGALIQRQAVSLIGDAEKAAEQPTGQAALSALIAPCVHHQLERPALARLLDYEEARLPLDPETERIKQRFFELTRATLRRPDLPRQPDTDLAAHDVVAIVKGMIDAAGEHGEEDRQGLTERVRRAVTGYLATAPEAG